MATALYGPAGAAGAGRSEFFDWAYAISAGGSRNPSASATTVTGPIVNRRCMVALPSNEKNHKFL
jgi:hypothetical protein